MAEHAGATVSLELPPALLESIVEAVTARVLERLEQEVSPWLTAAEAGAYLRWPVKRIYNLTSAGAIPHRKHEGRILLHRGELDRWLDGYREGRS